MKLQKFVAVMLAAAVITLPGCTQKRSTTASNTSGHSSAGSLASGVSANVSGVSGASGSLASGASGAANGFGANGGGSGSNNNQHASYYNEYNSTGGIYTSSHSNGKPVDVSGRVKNLNGRYIRINIADPAKTATADSQADLNYLKSVETSLNCHFQYEEGLSDESITASVLSGNPSVDIWWQTGGPDLYNHYRANLIQPLDGLKVFNWNDYPIFLDAGYIGGQHFSVTQRSPDAGNIGIGGAIRNKCLYVNFNLLKKYGVNDDLYGIQNSGQWTWDKFKAICKKFNQYAQSMNSSAKAFYTDYKSAYESIMATYNTDWIERNSENGSYTFIGGNSTAQAAVAYLKSMFDSKFATYSNNCNNAFCTGQSAFVMSDVQNISGIYGNATSSVKNDIGLMWLPKQSASGKYIVSRGAVEGGFCIPVGIKNAAQVATALDQYMYSPKNETQYKNYLLQLTQPSFSKDYGAKTEDTIMQMYNSAKSYMLLEYSEDIPNCTSPQFGSQASNGSDTDAGPIGKILSGQMSLATALNSVTNAYNTDLKNLTKR